MPRFFYETSVTTQFPKVTKLPAVLPENVTDRTRSLAAVVSVVTAAIVAVGAEPVLGMAFIGTAVVTRDSRISN